MDWTDELAHENMLLSLQILPYLLNGVSGKILYTAPNGTRGGFLIQPEIDPGVLSRMHRKENTFRY
jgi:hypothetical protein